MSLKSIIRKYNDIKTQIFNLQAELYHLDIICPRKSLNGLERVKGGLNRKEDDIVINRLHKKALIEFEIECLEFKKFSIESAFKTLSPKEQKIVECLKQGMFTRDIMKHTFLSKYMVEKYIDEIGNSLDDLLDVVLYD